VTALRLAGMRYFAAGLIALSLALGWGLYELEASAPSMACGDTPGFCPNPPDPPTWTVGNGTDF
jgi:hypothetical protein